MHDNNPSLTVSHVVSLTVPNKTAPAGSNPFEDDEDEEEEEEMVAEQTRVNHNSVNKEEIKTLVNRRTNSAHPQPPCLFLFLSLFHGFLFLPFLRFHYFAPFFLVTLSPSSGGKLLFCSAWSVKWHCTQSQCVSVLCS